MTELERDGAHRSIFKSFKLEDGRTLEMTKEEWESLVMYFRQLDLWKRELVRKGKWSLKEDSGQV